MSPLGFSLQFKLTPAGYERARLAAELGFEALGSHLPIRQLSVEQSGLWRTYLIGPVRNGGRHVKLACVEIGSTP